MNKRAPGFTLVEMLVVFVVAMVMLAAIFQTIVVQQRGYREENAIIKARQTARSSLDLLAAELREISATDGDLVMATADSVTFRAFRKAGIICDKDSPGNKVVVWQLGEAFADNDSVMIFAEDDTLVVDDDAWLPRKVSGRENRSCPTSWDGATDIALQGPQITVPEVHVGAMVRGFVPLTYGRYDVGGEWVVGRHGSDLVVEPLVGPIAAPAESGLEFHYFDAVGNEITTTDLATVAGRARVARIEITVRGRALGTGSPSRPEQLQTLVAQVALRGNKWP